MFDIDNIIIKSRHTLIFFCYMTIYSFFSLTNYISCATLPL